MVLFFSTQCCTCNWNLSHHDAPCGRDAACRVSLATTPTGKRGMPRLYRRERLLGDAARCVTTGGNVFRETGHAPSLRSGTIPSPHSPHTPTSVSHRTNNSFNPPNSPTERKTSAGETNPVRRRTTGRQTGGYIGPCHIVLI